MARRTTGGRVSWSALHLRRKERSRSHDEDLELAGLAGSIRVVPLLEVDEDALGVRLAVLARTLHHVDALDVSEADGFKDFLPDKAKVMLNKLATR